MEALVLAQGEGIERVARVGGDEPGGAAVLGRGVAVRGGGVPGRRGDQRDREPTDRHEGAELERREWEIGHTRSVPGTGLGLARKRLRPRSKRLRPR